MTSRELPARRREPLPATASAAPHESCGELQRAEESCHSSAGAAVQCGTLVWRRLSGVARYGAVQRGGRRSDVLYQDRHVVMPAAAEGMPTVQVITPPRACSARPGR